VTSSSGPGIALKGEAMGLAVMTELPLVIVDIQRGGPSTGLPTKTEQSDLLIALYGRHGEAPMPIVAAKSPSDCYNAAVEAVRMAVKYRMPVMVLTDGYIANGSEPWRLPDPDSLAPIEVNFAQPGEGPFRAYERDPVTLARPWAIPGTPGLEHRIGGLEKAEGTGNVSYDPDNHDYMVRMRARKVEALQADLPLTEVHGDAGGVCVVSWGGTSGAVHSGVEVARAQGLKVGHIHLRWLNPLPADLGEVLARYDKVLVPELNMGQLALVLRARYLIDTVSYTKIQGRPFKVSEILAKILTIA
jgi:2-oxoglutarate ferredoxin oxidoreductase subunit alpha